MYDEEPMERWPDDQLLRAAHQGDPEAFQLFCVRCLPRLKRHLRWQCQALGVPKHLAMDFTHDTIVKALTYFESYQADSPPVSAAWLFKIGYHLVIDWLRKNRKAKAIEVERRAIEQAPTNEEMERHEEVLKYFSWLRPDDQEILELVWLQELDIEEVAARIGISIDAAYKRQQRALETLRDLIAEHGGPIYVKSSQRQKGD